MFVLIISITAHEFAHAKMADLAGDPTPRRAGRISLNPIDHLDPLGTIMMVLTSITGIGIGWAKPVPVNPWNFRRPRFDNIRVSMAGPFANLTLAFIFAQFIRFGHENTALVGLLDRFVLINIALAIFNLLPIAPLDGSHVASSLLPPKLARSYDSFMSMYGPILFIGLVLLVPSLLSMLLGPPVFFIYRLFAGG
jgi:Zn-dependent protease